MAKFLNIREKLLNIDRIIYCEEFEDCEDILDFETRETKRKYFTSVRLYFSKDNFLTCKGITIREIERLMNEVQIQNF